MQELSGLPGGTVDRAEAASALVRLAREAFPDSGRATSGVAASRVVPVRPVGDEPRPDSPSKFLVLDRRDRPIGFAFADAPSAPGMVARNGDRAREARRVLGPDVGRPVLVPLGQTSLGGLGMAVYPYCQPLARTRLEWGFQRSSVRRWAAEWLRQVAARTARPPADDAGAVAGFMRPLEVLASMGAVDEGLRAGSREALRRLQQGLWRPRHVLMHGDLWKGNLMVRSGAGALHRLRPSQCDVAVIDWATAELTGYALFDLVRMADSLGLDAATFRAEVLAHCAILECDIADAHGHLLAALGFRAANLDQFPVERFALMAARCHSTLSRAV